MSTPPFTPDPDDQYEAINSGAPPTQRDAVTPWDLYAATALRVVASGDIDRDGLLHQSDITTFAAQLADAMLEERNKRFGEPE